MGLRKKLNTANFTEKTSNKRETPPKMYARPPALDQY